MIRFLVRTLIVLLLFGGLDAAKILGIFCGPSRSHYIVISGLLKELADRGHEITSINAFPNEKPYKNFRDIELTELVIEYKRELGSPLNNQFDGFFSIFRNFEVAFTLVENAMNYPNIQKILKGNETFDLVISELILNEAVLGFGHHFNAPVIGFSSVGPSLLSNEITGNTEPVAWVPSFSSLYSDKMNFKCRLTNLMAVGFKNIFQKLYYFPRQEKIMHKFFPTAPDIYTVMHNVSLVLLHSHTSFGYPRPLMPNSIEIGGLCIPKPSPLPDDLQKFLDDAHDGAIYFSFGSNINSSDIKLEIRQAFVKVFSKLKYRVIWKWDEDTIPGLSNNVRLGKWFPQSDILAHPNVKLFITHGGLGSISESIWHAVPMIGIPLFAEQPANIAKVVHFEIGIKLDFKTITEQSLTEALKEVLDNPKYAKNVQKRSDAYRDQPQTPLEKAIFWIEFVLRHGGAPHLRPAVFDLYWYQNYLLDIWLFIFVLIFLIILTIRYLFKILCRRRNKKVKIN